MIMKNLLTRIHMNQNMNQSRTNQNMSLSPTMIMKNLLTRIHMNQNMNQSRTNQNTNQSRTNQNMSLSPTMNMKNLLTRNHTNINMSPSHTMIMKPLITIPMSPISLSMSISKNIPIHLPNTSMATNNLSTRNMAAVIIITKNHMG